jgi:type IV secretion system protein VirB10
MARRPLLLAGATLLALAACDDQPRRQQAQQPSQVAVDTSQTAQANDELLRAIRARPTTPGRLAPSETQLLLDVPAGEEVRRVLTLTNRDGEDTRPVRIVSVAATGSAEGLTLGGSCRAGAEVSPGLSCEIAITYRDLTGRDRDVQILIRMENAREPQLEIPMRFSVVQPPPPPPPAPIVQIPQQPQGPDPRFLAALANGQARRFGATQEQGQVIAPSASVAGHQQGAFARPEIVRRATDPRFDPERIPWTETSLPIDRSRILTVDRVIPAILETPVSSQLCNQVIAVVSHNVFAPDNVNVLIPRGTRAIGRCQAFTDERVGIQWHRMITPNGVNISFQNLLADSADATGLGGVPGRVRERAFDRYAAPVIASLIDIASVAARAAFGENQTTSVDPVTGRETNTRSRWDAAIDDFNNTARQTLQNSVRGLLDTRRAIVVPGGTRLEIQIQEDIYFRSPTEVVRLADFEYELRRDARRPAAVIEAAPPVSLSPRVDGGRAGAADPFTVRIDGRTYRLQPGQAPEGQSFAPGTTPAAPPAEGTLPGQPGGMRPGVQGQSQFLQTPTYAAPPRSGGWQGGGGTWQGGGGTWQGGR